MKKAKEKQSEPLSEMFVMSNLKQVRNANLDARISPNRKVMSEGGSKQLISTLERIPRFASLNSDTQMAVIISKQLYNRGFTKAEQAAAKKFDLD